MNRNRSGTATGASEPGVRVGPDTALTGPVGDGGWDDPASVRAAPQPTRATVKGITRSVFLKEPTGP
ncbi:hypothetical protein [Alloactinosynnema sp. L-07]|nr:hypothetical protein [Alloactinosynnema sp. L-07]